MKTTRIVGHLAGSVPFTVVWLAGVNLPQGAPSPYLQAAAGMPQLVAIVSLLIQHAVDNSSEHEVVRWQTTPAVVTPRRPSPRPRQEVIQ